ncbi:MAG: hypothetical protein QW304_07640 [Thermoproteota archaeon]
MGEDQCVSITAVHCKKCGVTGSVSEGYETVVKLIRIPTEVTEERQQIMKKARALWREMQETE